MKTEQVKTRIKTHRKCRISCCIRRNWQMFSLLMLPVIMIFLFKYMSYPGLRIAFLDYKPALGYDGSTFVGMKNFIEIFQNEKFLLALRNTLVFNFLDLLVGFPMPVLLALLLNEIRFPGFKKVTQTLLYLPHFLSWVIIASVFFTLMKPESGLINVVLTNAGIIDKGIPFLTEKWHWAVSYLLIGVWQSMGWGTILYLAAISGISPELYEAATVDGAGRWRKIRHITLPGIKSTAVVLVIMNLGRILSSNFERLDSFDSVRVRAFQYQLAIFIYDKGLGSSQYSVATAVGLVQSLTGVVLIFLADRFAKMLGEEGLL